MTKQIVDGNNTVFAVADATNDVVAIDGLTGQELWRSHFTGPITSLLLGPDQRLYLTVVSGGRATLYSGTPGDAVSVASIAPTQPKASGVPQSITLFGSNFQSGSTVLITPPSGQSVLVSGSQIRSVGPNSLVATVNFNGVQGSYSLQVTSPSNVVSNALFFTVGCDLNVQASAPAFSTAGQQVLFSSTTGGCSGATYDWDFGDGTAHSSQATPMHAYASAGIYSWRVRVTPSAGNPVTRQGTIAVRPFSSANLRGFVGIGDSASGDVKYRLNKTGLVVLVRARNTSLQTEESVLAQNGFYEFSTLPIGPTYELTVEVDYDGLSGSQRTIFGPTTVPLASPKTHDLVLPPPIVMLHGVGSAGAKWNASWGPTARNRGFIVLTPTYGNCLLGNPTMCGVLGSHGVDWDSAASMVRAQIEGGFAFLSTDITLTNIPRWRAVCHSQGGLIARALTSGLYRTTSVVRRLEKVYLLGTPNSGGTFFGAGLGDLYLSEPSIRRTLNWSHPDFGGKPVAVFGGTSYFGRSDGVVTLTSLRHIIRERCLFGVCVSTFGSPFTAGCTLPVGHTALGGASTLDLLLESILPDVECPGETGRVPEAGSDSASAVESRTTMSESRTLSDGEVSTVPLVVGPTDYLRINVRDESGQSSVELLDPFGAPVDVANLPPGAGSQSSDEFGLHFELVNPASGAWGLRVTAQGGPCSTGVSASEHSPIAFELFPSEDVIGTGEAAVLLGRFSEPVSSPVISGELVDPSGTLVEPLAFLDDGLHGDGTAGDGLFGARTSVLSSAGTYVVRARSMATSQSLEFRRHTETSFDVRPVNEYFSGTFADSAVDTDDDVILDTVRVTADITASEAGVYTASAELVDSAGYSLDHAVASATATQPGVVTLVFEFSVRSVRCVQYGGSFKVRDLRLFGGPESAFLEAWLPDIAIATLDGNAFDCIQDVPNPQVGSIRPSVLLRGQSTDLVVNGRSFLPAATLSCGTGVVLTNVVVEGPQTIRATATVDLAAPLGTRDVSVANVDLNVGTGLGLLTISDDNPPTISIPYPLAGGVVEGTITTSASALDDVSIDRVEFRIDNVLVGTDSSFPYQFVWNTTAEAEGPHTLTAMAFDSIGQSTAVSVSVTADNCRITAPGNVTVSTPADSQQCGMVVNYPTPGATGGCGTVVCTPASGSLFPVGTTTVTCSTSTPDSASFLVTVTDGTAPVISCPAPVSGAAITMAGAPVIFATPVATDACSTPTVACVPPSGSMFAIGVTSVDCSTQDAAGNTGSCSFNVTIAPLGSDTAGIYVPGTGAWFLRDANSPGPADLVFGYGPAGLGWQALRGDWDGNGSDTVGLYDPVNGFYFLKNTNAPGGADLVYGFGPAGLGWMPLVGDWNGDGVDTIGLYDPASGFFFLRNSHAAGPADLVYGFGPAGAGWLPLSGDWDGDGDDTIGLYSPTNGFFFLRNVHAAGGADLVYGFGPAGLGWQARAGDWNGDGADTIGLYDPANGFFFLRNTHAAGAADIVFGYGPAGTVPLLGDWNGQ